MMMNIAKTSIYRQVPVLSRQQYVRMAPALLHTSSTQQKSIIEKAKDLGDNINKKVGQKLAEGIEGAEHVAHKAPNVKDLGHKANLKAGEKLAQGIDMAENSAEDLKHKAETIKHKAEHTKEEVRDTAEKTKHRVENETEEAADKIKRKLD